MQADTLLSKAFTVVCRIAWLNADRSPATYAVEEAPGELPHHQIGRDWLALPHLLDAERRAGHPILFR